MLKKAKEAVEVEEGEEAGARDSASPDLLLPGFPASLACLAFCLRLRQAGKLFLLPSHLVTGSHCCQSGQARYSGRSNTLMPR